MCLNVSERWVDMRPTSEIKIELEPPEMLEGSSGFQAKNNFEPQKGADISFLGSIRRINEPYNG
jgi:hypothetical protein